MIEKLETSWKLAKESWHVLMLDKEMLWFPMISAIASLLFLGIFGALVWSSGFITPQVADPVIIPPVFDVVLMAKFALISILLIYGLSFIVTFFNSALITCALIRLHGEDPILADGIGHAWRRIGSIFRWSLLAGTVGLILRFFTKRSGFLQRLFGEFLSLGWRVASFFVVPIIVSENKGPVDAFKGSVSLIKRTWGEALTIEVGLYVLSIPLMFPIGILFYLGVSMMEVLPMVGGVLVGLSIILVCAVTVITSTLDAIIKAALYMQASEGTNPQNFDQDALEGVVTQTSAGKPSLA